MHLFLALLAISTFAAAGPLPSFSNTTQAASTAALTPANVTFPCDPAVALAKLKAVYDSLNKTEPNVISNVKHDFLTWLEDASEAPAVRPRSPDSAPAPDNKAIGSDPVPTLFELKAFYDTLNKTEANEHPIVKRGFWEWLKAAFEAPGLRARSPDSASIPEAEASDSDPVAVLTNLKTIYDSLHEKRTDRRLNEKRGFWAWVMKHMVGSRDFQ